MGLLLLWQTKRTKKENRSGGQHSRPPPFVPGFVSTHRNQNSCLCPGWTPFCWWCNSIYIYGLFSKYDIKFTLDAHACFMCSRQRLKSRRRGRTSANRLRKRWKMRRWPKVNPHSSQMYISTNLNPAATNRDPGAQTASAHSCCPLFTSTDPQRHQRRLSVTDSKRHWNTRLNETHTHAHTQMLDLHIVLLIECQGFNERHKCQMDRAPVGVVCVCAWVTERQLWNLHLFNSINPFNIFTPAAK